MKRFLGGLPQRLWHRADWERSLLAKKLDWGQAESVVDQSGFSRTMFEPPSMNLPTQVCPSACHREDAPHQAAHLKTWHAARYAKMTVSKGIMRGRDNCGCTGSSSAKILTSTHSSSVRGSSSACCSPSHWLGEEGSVSPGPNGQGSMGFIPPVYKHGKPSREKP